MSKMAADVTCELDLQIQQSDGTFIKFPGLFRIPLSSTSIESVKIADVHDIIFGTIKVLPVYGTYSQSHTFESNS